MRCRSLGGLSIAWHGETIQGTTRDGGHRGVGNGRVNLGLDGRSPGNRCSRFGGSSSPVHPGARGLSVPRQACQFGGGGSWGWGGGGPPRSGLWGLGPLGLLGGGWVGSGERSHDERTETGKVYGK